MRQMVYERLSEAQACVEREDYQCAFDKLDAVGRMDDLSSYEQAQRWNFRAFLHYQQGDLERTVAAYERVLEQADTPLGLQRQALYGTATIYTNLSDYSRALDALERWFQITPEPSAEPFVLQAQMFYQTEDFERGLVSIQRAIGLAEQRGLEVEEGWYRLLCAMHFERGDLEAMTDTLENMIRLWPKRDYFLQLAGTHGKLGNKERQLDLYRGAYDAGWLERSAQVVSLARLLLQADRPAEAAEVMRRGLNDSTVELSEANLRLLREAERTEEEAQARAKALL
jgi:tetratricopeptide (TPR) repeat protein